MADDRDQVPEELRREIEAVNAWVAGREARARRNALVSAISAAISFAGALLFDPGTARVGTGQASTILQYAPQLFLVFSILQVGFTLFWLWIARQAKARGALDS